MLTAIQVKGKTEYTLVVAEGPIFVILGRRNRAFQHLPLSSAVEKSFCLCRPTLEILLNFILFVQANT